MKSKSFLAVAVLGSALLGCGAAVADTAYPSSGPAVTTFLRDPEHCLYMVVHSEKTSSEYEQRFTAAAKAAVDELATAAPAAASLHEALFTLRDLCSASMATRFK